MKKPVIKTKKKTMHGLGSSVSLSAVGVLLVIFLPWMIYKEGAGRAWIALGCYGGVLLLWQFFSYRLMRFSIQQDGVVTLPGFFSRRYREKNPVMRIIFAVIFSILLITAASALLHGMGDFAEYIFGIPAGYVEAGLLLLSFLLILLLGRGGLRLADRWIAIVTLLALVTINLAVLRFLGGEGVLKNIFHSWASGSVSEYVNIEYISGKQISVADHISMISYGFLILGNPLVLQRFQQAENGKTVHTSRRWAIMFCLIAPFCSIFAGGMLRAALYPAKIDSIKEFFRQIVVEVPTSGFVFYSACIIFIVTATLVVFDVFHSCILQVTQIMRDDFFLVITEMIQKYRAGKKKKKVDESFRKDWSLELIALFLELIVGFLAYHSRQDIYADLREMLIIVACGLAPALLLSLHCSRMNAAGTLAGFFGGAAAAVFWEFVKVFTMNGENAALKDMTGIHATLPAMAFGFLAAWLTAILTRKPDQTIVKEYEAVKYKYITGD